MITAEPGTPLGYICAMVDRLKPGECLAVDRFQLREIPLNPYMAGEGFTPADRVMENIVGSAFSHTLQIRPEDGSAVFCRVSEGEERRRTYTSPDYRPGGSKYRDFKRRQLERELRRKPELSSDGGPH